MTVLKSSGSDAAFPEFDTGAPSAPEFAEAAEFLRTVYPEGPWALTAITPDGPIITRVFTPGESDALFTFLRYYDGNSNIYWSVGEPRPGITKKATKKDIVRAHFLHVDIDALDGEAPNAAKKRALEALEAHEPKATAIVDSGGGIQALWKLAEPVILNGTGEAFAGVEARNKALAERLRGDKGAWNVDRILRLPGTTNIPNKKKLEKGRSTCKARVVRLTDEAISLNAFPIAKVQEQPIARSSGAPAKSTAGTNTKKEQVEALLAERGEDRSVRFFEATASAIDAGMTVDEFEALANEHHEGCAEKFIAEGRLRQEVDRAWARVEGDRASVLEQMNAKFFVIPLGGKARVGQFKLDPSEKRLTAEFFTFEDFKKLVVAPRVGKMGRGTWWLSRAKRRQYDGLVFAPGEPKEIGNDLNLWQGWRIAPREGSWALLKEHIRKVLACGDEEHFRYILRWTAWALKNPGKPAEVALVFKGKRGTGKGVFGRTLCDIFGQHGLHISSSVHLAGKFNAHLMDCAMLFADEAYWPGDKSAEGSLKRMITEPTLFIERKGVDGFRVANALKIVMATNEEWAVPAGIDERRFAVFEVSEEHKQQTAYFKALYAEIANAGAAAMMHELLALDLAGWHPREGVPQTEELRRQKLRSLEAEDEWIVSMIDQGWLPGATNDAPRQTQTNMLCDFARRTVPRLKYVSEHRLGRALRKKGGARKVKIKREGTTNRWVRGWEFPPLSQLRLQWIDLLGEGDGNEDDWEPDPDWTI